jgi:putative flippase GtrA
MLARHAVRLSRHPYTRFVAVGLIAYAVDAAVLAFATKILKLDPYTGRAISLAFAVPTAWYGNRVLTFSRQAAREGRLSVAAEFARSLVARGVGILVNYGLYAALVSLGPPPANNEFFALAVSGVVAMVLNFQMMKHFVFEPARRQNS